VNPDILRIIDANCNRAREAFRVLEDYARFSLNSQTISESLKHLRHDFQRATESMQSQAVAFRDTAGDVGTGITTESERSRNSLASVVTAAGKRLGEALRTIEEYAKVSEVQEAFAASSGVSGAGGNAGLPSLLESIRYRFYDVEKQILATLTPGRERMRGVGLYVLMTESLCKRPWRDVARLAIAGGADCLQLREKDLSSRELLARARELVAICREGGAISIINDRADIAILSNADGVHVGQTDTSAADVRRIVGSDKVVGVSTHRIEQARQAVLDGADYIGVGPMFTSTTKPQDNLAGLTYARAVHAELTIPAIAISGINPHNLSGLLDSGISAVAVSSSVLSADDPKEAATTLKRLIDERRS
jgi:thiamine-phosphate pyrophosphorylase